MERSAATSPAQPQRTQPHVFLLNWWQACDWRQCQWQFCKVDQSFLQTQLRSRVFIKALRNIQAGEELNYDYGLVIDEPYTAKLKADYQCLCGAKKCRGTLLAPKEKDERDAKSESTKRKRKGKRKSNHKKWCVCTGLPSSSGLLRQFGNK